MLEELWNRIVAEYHVCLMCTYRLDPAGADRKRGALHLITRSHSHSFSEEHDALLVEAVNSERPERDAPPTGPRDGSGRQPLVHPVDVGPVEARHVMGRRERFTIEEVR